MSNKTYSNPWAGLSSYQDPETSDVHLKFCGRDSETFDVAQLIDDNIFVTLYGKSGTGKTSLLNAGVFPRLRQEQYLPVSIRLGMDAIGISFQKCILTKIEQALRGKGNQTTVEVVPMPDDEQATEYLWSYFARTKFTDNTGCALFPILVFDQFEEVFRHRRIEAETLLRQIHFMMDENHALSDRMVDSQPYQYDFNFRFVASIREDDLYCLEDSIDNCYLPDLKRCRYRLRSLTEDGARQVILVPGEGLFHEEEQEQIIESILNMARNNEDGSISTNLLSLVCSRIYEMFNKSGAEHITLGLVNKFISDNPFEKFYNEATQGFSNREKSYIEDHLVDSNGRRNSIPESDFLLHVKNGNLLLEGSRKILQRISVSSDSKDYRIELIHDSFCEPLMGQKEKRKLRKRIKLFIGGLLIALCVIGAVSYHLFQLHETNKRITRNHMLFVAEKIKSLTDEGDSYTARRLAIEILPHNILDSNLDYLPEAEAALRYAYNHNTAILRGHLATISHATFSPNGKYILSTDFDSISPIRLWDANTGEIIKEFKGHSGYVYNAIFSPDGQTIVSISSDKTTKFWDVQSGKCTKTLKDSVYSFALNFSTNGNYLFENRDFSVYMYDVRTGRKIKTFDGLWIQGTDTDNKFIYCLDKQYDFTKVEINSGKKVYLLKLKDNNKVAFRAISPDKKKIIYLHDNKYLKVWDISSGRCILTLDNQEKNTDAVFSPQSNMIACTSEDGTVTIWNIETKESLSVLKGHTSYALSPCFSPDGKRLLTGSRDCTLRIWDVPDINNKNILKISGGIQTTYFSRDGKKILVPQRDSSICVYDIASKKCLYTLKDTVWVINAALSPDEKLIASVTSDSSVRIWSTESKTCIRKLRGHKQEVCYVSFSPDGQQLATASADSTVRIWNARSGKMLKTLIGANHKVYGVHYSHDGKHVYSMSRDSVIRVWDVAKGCCIKTIDFGEYYHQAKFSKDGKYVLYTYKFNIGLWDVEKGKLLRDWSGHTGPVSDFAYYPNSEKIVSVARDGTIKTWNYSSNIYINNERIGQYLYVIFSPDGKKMALVSDDRDYVLFKDLPPLQQIIDETRERFKNRQLTLEERRKYYLE